MKTLIFAVVGIAFLMASCQASIDNQTAKDCEYYNSVRDIPKMDLSNEQWSRASEISNTWWLNGNPCE